MRPSILIMMYWWQFYSLPGPPRICWCLSVWTVASMTRETWKPWPSSSRSEWKPNLFSITSSIVWGRYQVNLYIYIDVHFNIYISIFSVFLRMFALEIGEVECSVCSDASSFLHILSICKQLWVLCIESFLCLYLESCWISTQRTSVW